MRARDLPSVMKVILCVLSLFACLHFAPFTNLRKETHAWRLPSQTHPRHYMGLVVRSSGWNPPFLRSPPTVPFVTLKGGLTWIPPLCSLVLQWSVHASFLHRLHWELHCEPKWTEQSEGNCSYEQWSELNEPMKGKLTGNWPEHISHLMSSTSVPNHVFHGHSSCTILKCCGWWCVHSLPSLIPTNTRSLP